MEELFKKIKALRDMLKAIAPKAPQRPEAQQLPSIKQPTPPSMNTKPKAMVKIPGMNPSSKKDPKKIAEQLKSGQAKASPVKMLKTDKNGQWSLE